jgi:hypothetical protein
MSSSSSGSELKRWNFSAPGENETFFPANYMSYKNLLASEKTTDVNTCYSQNEKKNLINLWCAFITAMDVKGFGGIIIDVDASSREKKIVKAKDTNPINEVIIRNILDNGEKVLVGLFRGSCGKSASKNGLANFTVFSDIKTCTPLSGAQDMQQIAYFPSEYFSRLSGSKGTSDSVYSAVKNKLLSEYFNDNPLNYVFFSGTVRTVVKSSKTGNVNILLKSGQGEMLRRTLFHDSEVIKGVWTTYKTEYNDNYVENAIAIRVTDNEKSTYEGIAIDGAWYNGIYYGGKCLSWRLNFGSGVVFNYTGDLKLDSAKPLGGFITFEEIPPEKLTGVKDVRKIESLLVRPFTWREKTESENTETDGGIQVDVNDQGGKLEQKSVYVGQYSGNTFKQSGHGIKLFLSGDTSYIFIGIISDSGSFGVMYKITKIPPNVSGPVTGDVCTNNTVEAQWGKFAGTITSSSTPYDKDYYKQKSGSDIETDKDNALSHSKEAVSNFQEIRDNCSEIFDRVALQGEKIVQQVSVEYSNEWSGKFRNYDSILETAFDTINNSLVVIRSCEKRSSGKFVLPEPTMSVSKLVPLLQSSVSMSQSPLMGPSSPSLSLSSIPYQQMGTTSPSQDQSLHGSENLPNFGAFYNLNRKSFLPVKSFNIKPQSSSTQSSSTQSSTTQYSPNQFTIVQHPSIDASLKGAKPVELQLPVSGTVTGTNTSQLTDLDQISKIASGINKRTFSLGLPLPVGSTTSPPTKYQLLQQQQQLQQQQEEDQLQQQLRQLLQVSDSPQYQQFVPHLPPQFGQYRQQLGYQIQQQQQLQEQQQRLSLQHQIEQQKLQQKLQPYSNSPDIRAYHISQQLQQQLLQRQRIEQAQLQMGRDLEMTIDDMYKSVKGSTNMQGSLEAFQEKLERQLEKTLKSQRKVDEKISDLREKHSREYDEQAREMSELRSRNRELEASLRQSQQLGTPLNISQRGLEQSIPSALPAGWRELIDSTSGRTFYANDETKQTQWERPIFVAPPPASPQASSQASSHVSSTAAAVVAQSPAALDSGVASPAAAVAPVVTTSGDEIIVSECQRYTTTATFVHWENGFIAIGNNFLGYGKSRDEAEYRARTGRNLTSETSKKYYYEFPIIRCTAKTAETRNTVTRIYAMSVRYEGANGETGTQIFAFTDVNTRDKFRDRINELSAPARAAAAAAAADAAPPAASDTANVSPAAVSPAVATDANAPANVSPAAVSPAAQAAASDTASTASAASAASAARSSMTSERQQEAKYLLQKYLDDIEHYREIFVDLYQYKGLSTSIKAIMDNEIFLQFGTSYTAIKTELDSLISRLDDTGSPQSQPAGIEVTKTIAKVRQLLDKADTLKTKIIAAVKALPPGDKGDKGDKAALIEIAKEFVEQIEASDKKYKELSADSNITSIGEAVSDAGSVKKEVDALAYSLGNLKDFYDVDGRGANKEKLAQAKQYYNKLKQLVERIKTICGKADEILGKVSVFDKGARLDAQKLVNDIKKIQIEINIAAAKGLATLVTNMATSGDTAAAAAIAAGKEITAAYISEKKEGESSVTTITPVDFDKLTTKFKSSSAAYEAIRGAYYHLTNLEVSNKATSYYGKCQIYLNDADKMLLNFKGKKNELTSSLAEATESVESLKKIEKKSVDTLKQSYEPLKSQMLEFTKYMSEVDEKFKDIQKLMSDAAVDLEKLKAAQTAGMVAFGEYDKLKTPASDAASGDAPTSTKIDAAKKAADEAFKKVNELNESIIKKYSEAKVLAEGVMKDAKFSFIKEEAEAKVNELGNDNTSAEVAAKKLVDELETKRKVSYKISNIEQLKVESGKLDKLLEDMKKYEDTDIGPIVETVKAKNTEVASKIKAQAQAKETNITDITEDITGLVAAGDTAVGKAAKLQTAATGNLEQIQGLAGDIKKLYSGFEDRQSAELDSKAGSLGALVDKSVASLKEAEAIKDRIDKAVTAAAATQTRTKEMADLYAEIYKAYNEASESVTSFGLGTLISQRDVNMDANRKSVDKEYVPNAKAANDVIMGFSSGTVLNASQMTTIQQKYQEMTTCKSDLQRVLENISTQNGEFEQSVKIGLLDNLQGAIDKVTGIKSSIKTENLYIQGYAEKVLGLLTPFKSDTETKLKSTVGASNDLTAYIQKKIDNVDKLVTSAAQHIDGLKVLHKTDTCEYIGNRLIFDKNKLSGTGGDITFTGDDRIATQNKQVYTKCLWLRTVDGIPTDCPGPVEWKIKISNTETKTPGTNLPKLMMGIGLDSFNPMANGSRSGLDDCKPIPGFWGFSGTNMFNNGEQNLLTLDNIFKNGDEITFSLEPAGSVNTMKNFTLTIKTSQTKTSQTKNEIVFEIDSSVQFLYPVVRFKSNGDTYEIIHDAVAPDVVVAADAAPAPAPVVADAANKAPTKAPTKALPAPPIPVADAAAAAAAAAAIADDVVKKTTESLGDIKRILDNDVKKYSSDEFMILSLEAKIQKISHDYVSAERIISSLHKDYNTFFSIHPEFSKDLKPQGTRIGTNIIAGAKLVFEILTTVCGNITSELRSIKPLLSTSTSSSASVPSVPSDQDIKKIQQQVDFMRQIDENYQTIVKTFTADNTKFNIKEAMTLLVTNTSMYTNSISDIEGYANKIISNINIKLESIAGSLNSGFFGLGKSKPFPKSDTDITAIIIAALLELENDAKQYMSAVILSAVIPNFETRIRGSCTFIHNFYTTFDAIITNDQNANKLDLAADMMDKCSEILRNIEASNDLLVRYLTPLSTVVFEAASCESETAKSLNTLNITLGFGVIQKMVETANIALGNATELKEHTTLLSSYLEFIKNVATGVEPLLSDTHKILSDTDLSIVEVGGGGRRHGPGKGRGGGEKSLMTRRNRLRFKKSRVITRRSSSSRLSHLSRTSRARLGTHNKYGKGGKVVKGGKDGKGVKASTTRKLNGGVVVV